MIQRWLRFSHNGMVGFGLLDGQQIRVCDGDLLSAPQPGPLTLALDDVTLLAPLMPGKVLALWNNFHALSARLGRAPPAEPLYVLKPPNTYLAPHGTIRMPRCPGKVLFEGELAIVIGRRCSGVAEGDALDHVFGYTCANDVTLGDIIQRDPAFPQWVRAKGFDTFLPLGPVIATGLDPATLVVRTLLDGEVRQDYPISDMVFPVARLVSLISADMTLEPGDVILCGTSVGVGSMRPGSRIEIEIAGIGTLRNHFGARVDNSSD